MANGPNIFQMLLVKLSARRPICTVYELWGLLAYLEMATVAVNISNSCIASPSSCGLAIRHVLPVLIGGVIFSY